MLEKGDIATLQEEVNETNYKKNQQNKQLEFKSNVRQNQILRQNALEEELHQKRRELENEHQILSKLRAEWESELNSIKKGQLSKLVSFSDEISVEDRSKSPRGILQPN